MMEFEPGVAGGIQRTRKPGLPPNTPDVPLTDSGEVSTMLADCINRLRRGELDPRVANSIGYLAAVQLRCFDQALLHERVTNVENTLGLTQPRPIIHAQAVGEETPTDESRKPNKES